MAKAPTAATTDTERTDGAAGRRRVYIFHAGGTIGMAPTERGWAPRPGHLRRRLETIEELGRPEMPEFVLGEHEPLLDSADMTPADWLTIARAIAERHDDFDGFVVLHGTDTMAYTASALPFLLEGLSRPVVLTGAQIPLSQVRSDARENLITALLVAADSGIPEVCLLFASQILRGCRSVKVDAGGFTAFDSPNYPPLGSAGIEIEIDRSHVRPAPDGPSPTVFEPADPERPARIATLRLFPGISARVLDNVLQPPLQGLVLETYGSGTGPSRDPEFLAALERAAARGVVVVATSQSLSGRVALEAYATGRALADAGVVSGGDMTTEAALAKLFYLFSHGLEPAAVRAAVGRDLRGELTESSAGTTAPAAPVAPADV